MLIYKNSFIKIKKSLGRFFSLIFIVTLGSAFFSGLNETSKDMIKTMDNYFDEHHLMDYRIVSTMGLTDNDIASLKELDNVLEVESAYTYEAIIEEKSTKVISLSDKINTVKLVSGRMPVQDDEILVEENTYKIGDTINIPENDYLKNISYKVVGTIRSPLYIYENKGITTVGDGKLNTFMYVMPSSFKIDYYTEVYLIAKGSTERLSYSAAYDKEVEKLKEELDNLKPVRETARYEEILNTYMEEIYKAEAELNKNKKENEKKFKAALNALNDSETKLNKAKADYQNGINNLNNTKKEMESKFLTEETKLNTAKGQINSNLAFYNIKEDEIDNKINFLESSIEEINKVLNTLDPNSEQYQLYQQELVELNTSYNSLKELKKAILEFNLGKEKLDEGKSTWQSKLEESTNKLEAVKAEITSAEVSLIKGKNEYDSNYNTYLEEINKAEIEIADAREEVNSLEKPVWYLLNRNDNSGYSSFYECATKVDSIAKVFPSFFLLIAILMCLNTMTRMIDEERSEIGLFTSLGFSKGKIISSYILYVVVAAITGLILGLLIGYYAIPLALYNVYTASFIIPPLTTYFNVKSSIIISLFSLLAMILVTYFTALKDFKYMPACLLRPEAPKMGNKVFLEHIKLIWNHLSFSWKVTARNLFRYKKRIIMTLVGISGCTALLLTGFGLKDSVDSLIKLQFDEIQSFDMIGVLKDNIYHSDEEISNILRNNSINEEAYIYMESYNFKPKDENLDVYVMAFQDSEDILPYINLKDKQNNSISLSDDGVVVTEKMAELLNLKLGDTFKIRNSNNELFVLKVSAITKNYVSNYIYMNSNYYKKVFNSDKYNAVMFKTGNVDTKKLGNELLTSNKFNSILYTEDNIAFFEDVIDGMNDIVYLIIAFSTFLAITVLYNLTTINISERRREIASLKVLGFHDNEVSSYVYRETVILTIFGVLIGLIFGMFLNGFVLTIAETSEILFVKNIHLTSYIYTFMIMIFFTLIVQFITYFILRKINMIDSLKTVE